MKTINKKSYYVTKRLNKLINLNSILLLGGLILTSTGLSAATNPPIKSEASKAVVSASDEVRCNGNTSAPGKLMLPVGKSSLLQLNKLLQLSESIAILTVGNPDVVQSKLIAPQTLYVLGMNIGTTNIFIHGSKGTCAMIDVTVNMDPTELQQTLIELMPEEKNIKVTAAADSLVLSGTVEDAMTASRVEDIANAFVRRQAAKSAQEFEKGSNQGGGGVNVNFQQSQGVSATGAGARSPRLVNLLSVGSLQQVMLEVKIAEVSKSLLDKLGASLSLSRTNGSWTYRILTDFLSTAGSATGGAITGFKSADKNFALDAEKKDGLVKILAEPTIMAISGQEGSFLAGGKIFIPVSQQNNNGGTTITLEEKEFGVGVKFTPTVLAGGRINLKVAPEVSELNKEGVGISATGFNGTAILPSFTTRRAATTVQLMDGQSFAIGGLIKNNTTTNIKAFPILGEIPILGALFRSTDFQKDKTELIFIVTPHLVKPLPSKGYQLPTDNHQDPSRADIFLGGKLESSTPNPAPDKPASEKPATKPTDPAQDTDAGFDMR